jgi:hypothetical protein
MSITFEIDGATVLLASIHMLFDPEKARKSIEKDRNIRRCHLYPLLYAAADLSPFFHPAMSRVPG